jgi:PPP family 3-phenylpropionic acid transporter
MEARLGAFYFTYFCYLGAYSAYFTLWLADRGFSATQISVILAVPQTLRIFAPAFWGWLADRTDARRGIVVASSALAAGSFGCLGFASSMGEITAVLTVMGMFSAGVLPLVEATALSALAARHGAYGPVRLWGSIGFMASVLATGALLDAEPVAILFPVVLVLMVVGFAASLLMPSTHGAVSKAPNAGLLAVLERREVLLFFLACFCMTVAHGALYAFYSLHLVEAGYSKSMVGVMWTLGVAAEIGVFITLPWLFRRFSLPAVLIASFLAAAVRFVAIGWGVDSLLLVAAMQLLHALTFGSYHASSVAIVHRLFAGGLEVRGQALYASFVYGFGGACGTLVAGWLWEHMGASWTFTASGLFGLAGACMILMVRRTLSVHVR